MGIQELRIAGFRSLRDTAWEPKRLNVLIGPNGSGKSNLLRALELLRSGAEGTLPDEILRQGGMTPLLWDARAHEIAWSVTTPGIDKEGFERGDLKYELTLRQLGKTSAYRVEHEVLADNPFAPHLERRPGHAAAVDAEQRQLVAVEGSVPDDQTLLSLVAGPFGNPKALAFRNSLESWRIYHGFDVGQDAQLRQPAVARRERRLASDGRNLVPVLHTLYSEDREFKQLTQAAMRAAFGNDFEELVFPPAADQRIQLRLRWRSLQMEPSASDLSDGTIRFLLLLAVFGARHPGEVIAIDEPETGLHPSMLPVVAELAAEASDEAQVILTTHSPEFLDAFRDEPPATTVAQCVDGETHLSTLDGDELQRWLREYSLGALHRSGELEALV